MSSSYTQIILSKNQFQIPLVQNISVCSKYDPLKEAENFASQYDSSKKFFVIAGLCSGLHIQKLLEKDAERKIIVIENSADDFNFLMQIPQCKKLLNNKRIIFSTIESLFLDIIQNYFPALYGTLTFTFLRGWENAFNDKISLIKNLVEKALQTVKEDFAVQTNFGKIWQKNIFENLQLSSKQKNANSIFKEIKKNIHKTAVVIAAGPSLDFSIKKLKENSDKYFIIATDTAYSTLLKSHILPDAVVSIDGQALSRAHFLHQALYKKLSKNKTTFFILDLCSYSCISKKLAENNEKILFFSSGHPLSNLARFFNGENFIQLNAGSGTVTIAAGDFANVMGFKNTEYLGNDFCYSNGKPYTRGTYLDDSYFKTQNRLEPIEKKYTALMFRTNLINLKNGKTTTEVMAGYKKSFDYFIEAKQATLNANLNNFNFLDFTKWILEQLKKLDTNYMEELKNPVLYSLLPLMAYFEKKHTIAESYILARDNCIRYTQMI